MMAAPRAQARRRRAWRFGRWAESVSAWHLRARGYRVLARRVRTRAGEIDIVARRGAVLAIVEVKARADLGTAAEALDGRQRGAHRARRGRLFADPPVARRPRSALRRHAGAAVAPPSASGRRLAQRSLSLTAPRQESLPRPAAGK